MMGFAQKEAKLIREGNRSFKDGNFKEAEINFRKSLEINEQSVKGSFNLGDALYEQEDYESSQQLFDALSKKIENPKQRAEIFHNLGNSFLAADKYQESIDAYKNALRNNPADMDTKYNLEYARQKLDEQQQQDKDKQEQDKNEDQQDQEDKQDKQDQENKEDQQDQKDQEQNKDQNQDEQQQKNQQQQPKQISKQDAERMLQALKNEEKKTIEKLKKEKAKSAKATSSEKDW